MPPEYLSTILGLGQDFVSLQVAGHPIAPGYRGGKSEHRSAA